MKLEVQIEVDMPLDIIEDKHRLRGWSSTLVFLKASMKKEYLSE